MPLLLIVIALILAAFIGFNTPVLILLGLGIVLLLALAAVGP